MREYSRQYEHTRYPEEQEIEDPFLDASGLDPAGEIPHHDFGRDTARETSAEAELVDELIRREQLEAPPGDTWDEGIDTQPVLPEAHFHKAA